MAKQTFTTGQVLTAAQMTSLQQTAMGGGSATAKTASYVLVAADAGGTVAMNAAGATTITVNTALFAAGDTVFIQNLGAGSCVITAGTATVSTAGSLTLPQYDAGILYFTATGAAIFYDYIQTGAASPLTTKGDVYTFSTSDARLAVGTNNTVLTADSAEATGLKWAAASAGALTKITANSFSAQATVDVDGCFTSTYNNYLLVLNLFGDSAAQGYLQYRYSGTTQSATYYGAGFSQDRANTVANYGFDNVAQASIIPAHMDTTQESFAQINITGVGNTSEKVSHYGTGLTGQSMKALLFSGLQNTARTYTGFRLSANSGNISGNYAVYGYTN